MNGKEGERERQVAEEHERHGAPGRLAWGTIIGLFANAPVGIYIVQDGRFRYVNPEFIAQTGYAESDLLGRDSLSLVHPDDRERVRVNAIRMLKGVTSAPYEYRFLGRNGETEWILESVVPARYARKRATMGYFMNISGQKQAEEALRAAEVKAASEARYRKALDSLLEGCQIIDREWRYLYLNDVAVRHGQKMREELAGRTMMEAYPGIENTEMFARLRDCMEKRHPHRMENLFTYPDGSQRWFELSIEPVTEGIFILSVDITERRRLEEREAHLIRILKLIRDINQLIVVVENEPELLQKACEHIVAGRDYRMAWIGFTRSDSPEVETAAYAGSGDGPSAFARAEWDHCEQGQGPAGMAISTAGPFIVHNIPVEGRELPWREAALKNGCQSAAALPLRVDGEVVGAISVYSDQPVAFDEEELGLLAELAGDISLGIQKIRRREHEKQQEEAIRRAAEEWRATFDSVSDLLSVNDIKFRIVRVNRAFAEFFKAGPKDILGKVCYQVIHGADEPCAQCPFRRTQATRQPATEEFYEPRLRAYVRVSTWPLFDDRGNLSNCVHQLRDITEERQMKMHLMVTDRLASIGELASGVAHELNNPLTSIIGFSELLSQREDLSQDIREDVDLINREARRTAQIVRNLLTFARKHEAVMEPVDIPTIVRVVLSLRAYQQKIGNIEVVTRFAPGLPAVLGDSFQLQQVFMNIIINAEHFMTEAHGRGTLAIIGERAGEMVRLSFADDGPGIPEENLTRIFTPFFTTKEVGKGTGLGLSICHGIITEHGGSIYAESEPGKGATFIIELPVADAQQVSPAG